ncbi:unnamed protein product [Caretta caretta]
MANSAHQHLEDENIVCPLQLYGLFTAVAINKDHNPAPPQNYIQHPSAQDHLIMSRVPALNLKKTSSPIPEIYTDGQLITQALQGECRWLERVRQAASLEAFNGDQVISWAAYHARK